MNSRNDSSRSNNRSRRDLSPAERRIEWARSLTNEQMDALLQNALLHTRGATPRTHEVILLEEVVHELKSRLSRYQKGYGEAPEPVKRGQDYDNEES